MIETINVRNRATQGLEPIPFNGAGLYFPLTPFQYVAYVVNRHDVWNHLDLMIAVCENPGKAGG
jgi:hypothetical protein